MAKSEDIAADLEAQCERLETALDQLRDEVIELRKFSHRIASQGEAPAVREAPRPAVRVLRAAHE